MRIQPTSNISFKSYTIQAKDNKHCKYLYNELLDIVKEEKVGAVFDPKTVVINSDKESIAQKLNKLAIKFLHKGK